MIYSIGITKRQGALKAQTAGQSRESHQEASENLALIACYSIQLEIKWRTVERAIKAHITSFGGKN